MGMKQFLTSTTLLLALLAPGAADAAMTEWQDIGGGRARLVATVDPATNLVSAALEMELNEGWKTYWRQPGGSGIPPQFDFSGSQHFMPGEVELPAPHALTAGGANFAGYKEPTAFYFTGQMLASDGRIAIDMLAGVCQEICIPAQAHFEISFSELNASDPRAETAIAMARSALPAEPRNDFRVEIAGQAPDGTLTVQARTAGDERPELFVEGPQGWYFPPAQLVSVAGGVASFKIGPPEKPKDAPVAEKLRFTLRAGNSAIEQWVAPQR
jgi:DsbC/DsbD-like thiol-disulfide interchange protein